MLTWIKPVEGEYLPYQLNYIKRVPDGDLLEILGNNIESTINFLNSLPEEKLNFRYAEGKWTPKQIIQHLIDSERIMTYRMLTFARNDKTELPGFEENDYAVESNADERTLEELTTEFKTVRNSSISLIRSFNDELLRRSGIANKGRITVSALVYVIAGHELHHMSVIKERYL